MTVKRAKGASKATLAQRKALFIEAMVANGGNQTKAAEAAGYSKGKSSEQAGRRLMREVGVCRELEARRAQVIAAAAEKTGLTVERTLQELARLAYSDPRRLYHDDGRMKGIHELDDDAAACIASVEVDKIGVDGNVVGYTKKVKQWDKNAALEKAMKYHGLYEKDNAQQPPGTVLHLPGVKAVKFKPLSGHR